MLSHTQEETDGWREREKTRRREKVTSNGW
jgi:hypothetical protein